MTQYPNPEHPQGSGGVPPYGPGVQPQQPAPYGTPQGSAPYSQPGMGQPQGMPGGYPPVVGEGKSRVVAGLLGILVGAFGIHRFYLGYTGIGVAMLLVSVLSLGILAPLVATWGLVEGILYLVAKDGYYSVDAQGRPLVSS